MNPFLPPPFHAPEPADPPRHPVPDRSHFTSLSPALTKAVRKWCRVTGALDDTAAVTGRSAWDAMEWQKFLWFEWAAQHRSGGPDLELLDWVLIEPDDTS